jgi:hypothetical protein
MILHKMMAEGGMSIDEIGRMTLPQLMCRAAPDPPSTTRKFTSYPAYEAEIRRQEEAWSASS